MTESKVLVVKRSSLVALAARDTQVARQLWTITAGSWSAPSSIFWR